MGLIHHPGPLRRHEDNQNEVLDKYAVKFCHPIVLIALLPHHRYGQRISFYKDVSKILHNLRLRSQPLSVDSDSKNVEDQNVIIAACSRTHAPNLYVSKHIIIFFFPPSLFIQKCPGMPSTAACSA